LSTQHIMLRPCKQGIAAGRQRDLTYIF
jgi:hypothetical protein